MQVAALVVGEGRARPAGCEVVTHPGPWREALAAAPRADWVWLLRGDTEPAEGALEALLAAAGTPGLPAPALLASKVVTPDGALHAASAPWPPLHDREGAMDAAIHRLAAVRMARWGSLLVRSDALHAAAPPRADVGDADDLEWTGRLLRGAPGYLVPRSRAVRRDAGRPARLGTLRAAALSDAWDTQERLWLVYASLLEGSGPNPSRNARPIVDKLSRLPRLVRR